MTSPIFKSKSSFLLKIIFFYLIFCLKSYSSNENIDDSLIVIGSDDAPVKIKVFSSLTCPHCASFHINVISEIKKNM